MTLPVTYSGAGTYEVLNRETGELVPLTDATDRVLAQAAQELAAMDAKTLSYRRAIAAEMRRRHGVGTAHAGGYRLVVSEKRSWPLKATQIALQSLVERGVMSDTEAASYVRTKVETHATRLNALLTRLGSDDPEAAATLRAAMTVSPPNVRDVELESVDAEGDAS